MTLECGLGFRRAAKQRDEKKEMRKAAFGKVS
jgi:hypothetical protein